MKRLFSIFLMIVIFCCYCSCVYGANTKDIKVYIQQTNGVFKVLSTEYGKTFVDRQARTQVPLRAFAEAVEDFSSGKKAFSVIYQEYKGKQYVDVVNNNNNTGYRFIIGQNEILRNGSLYKRMDTEAIIIDDRTYIPIRFAAECLGFTVKWDEKNRTVHCYKNK